MTFLRVSSAAAHLHAIDDISRARKDFERLQEKLVSGKEVNRPKDDPVAIQKIYSFDNKIAKNDQFVRNIDFSTGLLEVTSSTLSRIEEILMDIRNTAQALKGSVVTSAEREAAGATVEVMLEELVQLANTKYLGKFIFGGTNTLSGTTATPNPFNITEDSNGFITAVAPNADGIDDLTYREMREGLEIAVNLSGSAPFMPNGQGGSGDVFQSVMNLRDDLLTNTQSDLESDIEAIEEAITQVVGKDTDVGIRINQIERVRDQVETMNISNKDQRSRLAEVDYSELLIKFNTAQTTLTATLQTSAQLLQLSLVNFIG